MKLVVHKTSALHGCVLSPSSKSDSIRALFCALLASGESTINNLLAADDTAAAIHVCQQLGAEIICDFEKAQSILMRSNGIPFTTKDTIIHSSNSGLSTHFVLPLLGLRQNYEQPVTLDCGDQMRERPVQPLIAALRLLGMEIDYAAALGKLPLKINGRLLGGNACVDGTTSQYLSALLLALPCAEKDSEIVVKHLAERPYVNMTLDWLQRQNIRYEHHCGDVYDTFWITGKQHYTPFTRTMSGDFSSMSTVIAAAVLLPSEVQLFGLDMLDAQGDKQLITLLQTMGADITVAQNTITIRGGKPLTAIDIDVRDIPDLVPILAVLGTQANGVTRITHAAHTRIKETDRLHAIADGLRQLGASIRELPDGLLIQKSQLHGSVVNGYGDHRTVMALSVAGMVADTATNISDAAAVSKTFPGFIEQMQLLGAKVETIND